MKRRWRAVSVVPPHQCAFPTSRERRKARMCIGSRIQCDCGRVYEWTANYAGEFWWYLGTPEGSA